MVFDYAKSIVGCARGDRGALRALFDEEAGRMVGIAQRIVRRRELAEEVVQEAFVQIWQKSSTFDANGGSARGWIYAIVRNRALNVIRDGSREDLTDSFEISELQDRMTVADDAFERLHADSRLRACLEAIDEPKRRCLLLSYVAGYSHGEVAGLLGVPLGTAKSWLRRGLDALKECMA
ncbi:MAG: sigma-70 family RNA polymerase sigma factor [Hyphomicrobiaceae bacterium]|nr:sigma-70 family RNA polymerase sigma factor [Hyphomicrobiaceae bacterium]